MFNTYIMVTPTVADCLVVGAKCSATSARSCLAQKRSRRTLVSACRRAITPHTPRYANYCIFSIIISRSSLFFMFTLVEFYTIISQLEWLTKRFIRKKWSENPELPLEYKAVTLANIPWRRTETEASKLTIPLMFL